MRRVRKTYDGPLALALDYMVFNVSKDDVSVRMSAVDDEIWPSPAMRKKNPPDTSKAIPFSDFTKSGVVPLPEVVKPIYQEINGARRPIAGGYVQQANRSRRSLQELRVRMVVPPDCLHGTS